MYFSQNLCKIKKLYLKAYFVTRLKPRSRRSGGEASLGQFTCREWKCHGRRLPSNSGCWRPPHLSSLATLSNFVKTLKERPDRVCKQKELPCTAGRVERHYPSHVFASKHFEKPVLFMIYIYYILMLISFFSLVGS